MSAVPQKVNLSFEAAVLIGDVPKPAPRGTGFACFRCGAGASPLRGPSPGVIVKHRIHRKFRKENRQYWRLTNVRIYGTAYFLRRARRGHWSCADRAWGNPAPGPGCFGRNDPGRPSAEPDSWPASGPRGAETRYPLSLRKFIDVRFRNHECRR